MVNVQSHVHMYVEHICKICTSHFVALFTGSRMLRVWSRDGVLSSTSETVDGLEQALFWK